MPALTPIQLWERTGRVEAFGNVLIQFEVRRQGKKVQMALGPTHEEPITDLASKFLNSYRQMPLTLYQIQTKFRNEERPRFGVLRTSEFLMKDAYSFDTSVDGLNASYDKMYAAYCKIFTRCGLDYLAVEAESGPIGGDASHEFMCITSNGEDTVVYDPKSGYAANVERAEIGKRNVARSTVEPKPLTKLHTPNVGSIEAVSKFLKCKPHQMLKTLIYSADDKPIAVLIRGDHEANENKIRRAVGAKKLALAENDVVERVTGAPVGFAGPVGLKEQVPVWADEDVAGMANCIVGANEGDYHFVGANLDRDFKVDHFADLRNAAEGDPSPRSDAKLEVRKTVEIGHVFKLGTKYSEALGAKFLDDKEQQQTIIMGCYGIGVNRILASLIETKSDANGIIWPMSIAPYEVIVSTVNAQEAEVVAAGEKLYGELQQLGVDVLYDDRDQRPGVKFKDADLIGIPLRVVVGGRGLKEGNLELKWRTKEKADMIPVAGAAEAIAKLVAAERDKYR
jgi:prolyl-tRNA synthetase